jgi:hypothetical protein
VSFYLLGDTEIPSILDLSTSSSSCLD